MDWLGLAVGVVGIGIGIVALLEMVPKDFRSFTLYGGIALVVIGLSMMLVPVGKGTRKFLWLRFGPLPLPSLFAGILESPKVFPKNMDLGVKNQIFSDAVVLMAKRGWITVFGEKPFRGQSSRLVAIPQSYFDNHQILITPHYGTASTYNASTFTEEGERESFDHTLPGMEDRYFNLHVQHLTKNIIMTLANIIMNREQ